MRRRGFDAEAAVRSQSTRATALGRALALALGCALGLAAGCGTGPPPPDSVWIAARIYSLAGPPPARVEDEPVAAALAVRGGRIVALGSERDIRRLAGGATRVHVFPSATILPGLVDCHVHLASLGRSLREVDLIGTRSWDEVVARVRERSAGTPHGDWITGGGWDQNDWPVPAFPDHAALSSAVPDHPVLLRRVDGHAAIANAAALALAGVEASTPDPHGGRIERRPDGAPTGVLVDAAVALVSRHLPPPAAGERRDRLRLALAHCVAAGLTGVHDAGAGGKDVEDARALLAAGELPLRLYSMWDGTPDPDGTTAAAALHAAGPQGFDPTGRLALRTVKLMVDGALGSRGAALLAPYADAPDQVGLPQYTTEQFYELARPLHAAGFQLATHCIGDAANRLVLDVYERLLRELPRPDARHRIEHAQVIDAADLPRFAALGVLASMQPTHCTSDMPWAPVRLGPERLRGAYAWRSLRATGALLPLGSDAPVETVNPLAGIYAAVTRQDARGHPASGWVPEERLTASEAVRGFTAWAAYASFTEQDLGTLEPGKLADLVVLDRDVLRVAPPEILAVQVLATVVGGEIVHPKPTAAGP
jgi:hypothetical protein